MYSHFIRGKKWKINADLLVSFLQLLHLLQVGGNLYPTKLIDLSLKGALIEVPATSELEVGEACNLSFSLGDADVNIEFDGEITHIEKAAIGIVCNKMELESASHLKRLIELNVGSEDLLHRNLENLSHPEHE